MAAQHQVQMATQPPVEVVELAARAFVVPSQAPRWAPRSRGEAAPNQPRVGIHRAPPERLEPWKYVATDLLAAATSAVAVAPAVCIIDQAITQNAAGTSTLSASMKGSFITMAQRPLTFMRSPACLMLGAVYLSTYGSANVASTLCTVRGTNPVIPVLAASTLTNTTGSILKDCFFARMFGAIKPSPVPTISYALWLARDAVSMGFVFTIPAALTPVVHRFLSEEEGGDGNNNKTNSSSVRTAIQLAAPVSAQVVTTVFSLVGLDYYNRRDATVGERIAFLKKEYWKTMLLRCGRIFVPFSIGAVLNTHIREILPRSE